MTPTHARASAIMGAARTLADRLRLAAPISGATLTEAMTKSAGGSDFQGAWQQRDSFEALEVALSLAIPELVGPMEVAAAISALEAIARALPTQTVRSEDQIQFQQFSTPPALACLAVHLARLSSDDVVLEPSAGTGIIAALAKRVAGNLILNELEATRADLLEAVFPGTKVYRHDGANLKVSRARYETAVLATLRDKLRAGDVWVEGTRAYQRFDAYLLPRKAAQSAIADLPINVNAGEYLAEKSAELDRRLRHFAHQLRTGRLSGVALVRDRLKVVPLQAATPLDAEVLDRRLDSLLPRVRITELLFEVAERTGFLAAFRDVRSGKEHDKPQAILAAILADGTNLGVERMANASQGVTYAQLAWTQNWYISPENYEAALAQIVREHHQLPFARNWGEGISASSDGQFFRTGRIRSGAAEINAKYGHEPGIKIYSHLSDHFASFSSRIMSATASEAPYVLDGLMLGARDLPLQELYTDTGGASDHVFGLCHLLGFRFVPRMRDLADRRLGAIAANSTYKGIERLFGQAIKVGAIEAEWDDLVRMAASIREGAVAPSVILRKLSAYRRQNKLDLALRELGRIERTLFTLDWLEQPELRRACQAGLNKGEARHALADAIYTNRQGRFTDRTFENQQYRASGLNLLIAAIAYWNTLYLGRAADYIRHSGVEIDEALLAHVSPLGWSHIGLTGDYLWEDASFRDGGGYRPLHDPSGRLRLVA